MLQSTTSQAMVLERSKDHSFEMIVSDSPFGHLFWSAPCVLFLMQISKSSDQMKPFPLPNSKGHPNPTYNEEFNC